MDMGSSPSPPPPPVLEGRRALEGDEERVRSRAEVARKEEPRRDSAFTGSWSVENETWYVSVYERGHRSNTEEEFKLTAYLTPTIQLPPMTSPVLSHRPHRVRGVPVPDPETVDDFRARVRVGAVPEMLEIFGGDAVSISGIAKDDHVDGFGGEAGSSGLRLGVGVGG